MGEVEVKTGFLWVFLAGFSSQLVFGSTRLNTRGSTGIMLLNECFLDNVEQDYTGDS